VADGVQTRGARARLLFVKGPYFPARIPIPSRFEIVPDEDQMPALLKIAKAAVIRAGFNTPWECIAGGTPFMPQIGTTYAEPVAERVNRLTSFGLVAPNVESLWFDDNWRAEYRRKAKSVVAKHPGVPEPRELARLILGPQRVRPAAKPKPHAIRRSKTKRGIPLVIRIDDVVSEEPALCWLLELLAERGMRASLEAVPYLLQLDDAFLDRFDPSGTLFEVSQHGYAHVPRTSDSGQRFEFSPECAAPTSEESSEIARGKRQIEKAFPKRFAGGFSPPYDALPPWLPETWHTLGGIFVSSLQKNSMPGAPLPVRRAGVEVWNWTLDSAFSRARVMHKLALQLAVDGHAGIVLHAQCLRNRPDKMRLLSLLNAIEDSVSTVSLRDLALGKIEPASADSQVWSSFGQKLLRRSHGSLTSERPDEPKWEIS